MVSGTRDNPSPQPTPRVTLAEVTFSLFLCRIQPTFYIRIANPSLGARQLGWESCLASVDRLSLANGATFLHINALATLDVASVTLCLGLGFKAKIRVKEVKMNSAKPTVIK